MDLTRREAMILSASAAALALVPLPSFAAVEKETTEDAIAKFTGGADVKEGGVEIKAPQIAENGSTVPIEVSATGATAIMVVSTKNPFPNVVMFRFGKLAAKSQASTRIRLAETQDIIAIAKLGDGTFVKASRNVKVTIGGCGG